MVMDIKTRHVNTTPTTSPMVPSILSGNSSSGRLSGLEIEKDHIARPTFPDEMGKVRNPYYGRRKGRSYGTLNGVRPGASRTVPRGIILEQSLIVATLIHDSRAVVSARRLNGPEDDLPVPLVESHVPSRSRDFYSQRISVWASMKDKTALRRGISTRASIMDKPLSCSITVGIVPLITVVILLSEPNRHGLDHV